MPALKVGANCEPQPVTSKVLEGSSWNGSAAVLLQGMSSEVVFAGPQVDGFASGAPGPSSVCRDSFSNGCWGLLSKTVVSCPFFWLTWVRPANLIRTSVGLPGCSSCSCACRNSRSILPSAASLGPQGEHSGWPTNSWPVTSFSSSGVLMRTFPTSEAFGHCASSTDARSNCASLHASRPFAAEGDATVPSGRVTDESFRSGVARFCELSFWGTSRLTP